jgi:hypothetical protein
MTLFLGIIAIVLLFRIFNAAQDACIARGVLQSRTRMGDYRFNGQAQDWRMTDAQAPFLPISATN